MSLEGAYDAGNIFAKIIRDEAPAARVFEDDYSLVFMDAFPQARGHMMVIAKQSRARNILDVEPEELQRLVLTVQRVVRAAKVALKPDGIMVSQFNGAPAGQSVFHLHFHVIPRWEGVALGRHGQGMADPKELAELAHLIASNLD